MEFGKIYECKVIVRSECEDCSFKRNNVEITGTKFTNNAGFITINHLEKNRGHIIKLLIGTLVYRYKLNGNSFTQIENEVKGD